MFKTAYKFIRFDRAKSIGIITGIVISVFLIGQQLGTLGYLSGLMSGIVRNSNTQIAKIWVVDRRVNNANALNTINYSLVNELKSIPGVQETYPILVINAEAKFAAGNVAPVTLLGSSAPAFILGPPQHLIVKGNLHDLMQSGSVSADYFDKKNYKKPVQLGEMLEINGKQAIINLETKSAQGFGASFMFTSLENARYFSDSPSQNISAVLVQPKAGTVTDSLVNAINSHFSHVKAWKATDLQESSVSVILKESSMGISFGSLIGFAVISGFFIIGLLLYSSAFDRIKDYGTLKAIGANNRYVSKLIICQAIIYAFIGFLIAVILLYLMKWGMASSGLILVITPIMLLELLAMTLFICIGGSLFALQKIKKLEPASVFR
ncbi:FtsX-like permease family protein [Ornithobacterium rhinotracheale]|uniref:ABC transporter permease n=1 Tax=Ornithobacterium rhinotracheale TaxID=28251 RepID=UPI00129C8B06|nr:FtsX-like permease family protein [Ornithobacterium rhinotracheale]MRI62441.1 FtsX-like permease family protein [Ornithobacterium rhinotracheale]MRJ10827.1 FtsX-like permease family protein [Ornithobacterium rhinotracheale]